MRSLATVVRRLATETEAGKVIPTDNEQRAFEWFATMKSQCDMWQTNRNVESEI